MTTHLARCMNAEPGTFGHECGKSAKWIGTKHSTITKGEFFHATFCDECKECGWERHGVIEWRAI